MSIIKRMIFSNVDLYICLQIEEIAEDKSSSCDDVSDREEEQCGEGNTQTM